MTHKENQANDILGCDIGHWQDENHTKPSQTPVGKSTPNSLGCLHLGPFSTLYKLLGPRVRHCNEGSRTSISDTPHSCFWVCPGVSNKTVLSSLGFSRIHRAKKKDRTVCKPFPPQKNHKLSIFKREANISQKVQNKKDHLPNSEVHFQIIFFPK